MDRYLTSCIHSDLSEKMVFLGGPRQVGKATIALTLLGADSEDHPGYFNYDFAEMRHSILKGQFPSDETLIVLDEIHKHKDWRNLIKGFYDIMKSRHSFLITGSARLDYYRRGGDSLQGRYHYLRLHPLHLDEVDDFDTLLKLGGFPEPFLSGDKRSWKRWQNERRKRVLQEDLISMESVREVSQVDLLATSLPERVGSLLSVKNLAKDLKVAFETADRWIQILENLYYCFRIQPWASKKLQSTKKERKVYMWDWSLCQNPGSRIENFVASYLLKYCHFREDYYGENIELRFLRDREQREIDFLLVKDGVPFAGFECKSQSKTIAPHLSYFSERLDIPQYFQLHQGDQDYQSKDGRIRCMPVTRLAQLLPLDAS